MKGLHEGKQRTRGEGLKVVSWVLETSPVADNPLGGLGMGAELSGLRRRGRVLVNESWASMQRWGGTTRVVGTV